MYICNVFFFHRRGLFHKITNKLPLNPGSDTFALVEPPFLRCYNENQKVHEVVLNIWGATLVYERQISTADIASLGTCSHYTFSPVGSFCRSGICGCSFYLHEREPSIND